MTEPHPAEQPHDEAEALLPWYATGKLDAADRAIVETHLATCAHCQRQLGIERRLAAELPSLSPEAEGGWARLRRQIEAGEAPRRTARTGLGDFWEFLRRPAIAGLVAAQLLFVVLAGGLLLSTSRSTYETLGSSGAPARANVIVMFRADSSEADIRQLLSSAGATFVGGPTGSNAYLLHVPEEARSRSLAALQASPRVTMAQPIDGDQP